eukprot:TRINITY_DN3462_c0_g1_i9.p1 TRINITY_DN3462_c0_g1~~TRINITY_DN3462_c0_g1_i9.p1  ORF type:complete len:233 (+),score=69.26 TRINITY_DN3462_c0_g1_i9:154-852(+)
MQTRMNNTQSSKKAPKKTTAEPYKKNVKQVKGSSKKVSDAYTIEKLMNIVDANMVSGGSVQQTPISLPKVSLDKSEWEFEQKRIKEAEDKLANKAKELEEYMNSIKQSKIQLALKQFEEQLRADGNTELKHQTEIIENEYNRKLGEVMKQRNQYMERVDELKDKLRENIDFFSVVMHDLEVKTADLETCYGACVEYVKKECKEAEFGCALNMEKHIEGRLRIFENYITSQTS